MVRLKVEYRIVDLHHALPSLEIRVLEQDESLRVYDSEYIFKGFSFRSVSYPSPRPDPKYMKHFKGLPGIYIRGRAQDRDQEWDKTCGNAELEDIHAYLQAMAQGLAEFNGHDHPVTCIKPSGVLW
jgi:hypothetical protein